MRIRTPIDLGAVIRDQRTKLGLDQQSLAGKAGVSRQWIVEIEKGKPRAEIGLVLRAFEALGIHLAVDDPGKTTGQESLPLVDIDSIVSAARKKKRKKRK